MISDMLAHANMVIQAAQQFEGDGWRVYDRAFRLQVASTPTLHWGSLNLTLYARRFMAMEQRRNVCRFCFSRDHQSQQCPWGVDTPTSCPQTYGQQAPRWSRSSIGTTTICQSWNAGACIFPNLCNFRHICSICAMEHCKVDCPKKPNTGYVKAKTPCRGPTPRA